MTDACDVGESFVFPKKATGLAIGIRETHGAEGSGILKGVVRYLEYAHYQLHRADLRGKVAIGYGMRSRRFDSPISIHRRNQYWRSLTIDQSLSSDNHRKRKLVYIVETARVEDEQRRSLLTG